ncbi:MAG: hypothetical protein JF565_00915 [Propionibacteriales bacterium]|jgi:hypothetical protein|nr:hypothetical protein [Propionibacteriales bacterium]
MRVTVILSTVVLGAGLLAGCGSSGDKAGSGDKGGSSASGYCKDLKAAQSDFTTLNSDTPDFTKLDDAIKTFHKLADEAPSAVDDDWKTLDNAFSTLTKALDDAGISMDDLAKITSGQMPEGMTQDDLAALGPKLQSTFGSLDQDAVKKAGQNVEKHAKSVCKVDLTKS